MFGFLKRWRLRRRVVRTRLCPFHVEKTPSLAIFDDGTYFCFGCGREGNAGELK